MRGAQGEHAALDGRVGHDHLGPRRRPPVGVGAPAQGRARLKLKGDGLAGAVREEELQQAGLRGGLVAVRGERRER